MNKAVAFMTAGMIQGKNMEQVPGYSVNGIQTFIGPASLLSQE